MYVIAINADTLSTKYIQKLRQMHTNNHDSVLVLHTDVPLLNSYKVFYIDNVLPYAKDTIKILLDKEKKNGTVYAKSVPKTAHNESELKRAEKRERDLLEQGQTRSR